MPTVDLSHGALYYVPTGPEDSPYPPLVLIHGAGGSRLDWPPQLRRIADVRALALDLPAHGRSDGPSLTDTKDHANVVCAFLDALDIDRAIIAGHSMGGAIAQQIGIHMPDRAAGLILVGTGSKLPVDPSLVQRIVDEPAETIDWITDWAWHDNAPVDIKQLGRERLKAVATGVLRDDYHACQIFDVRDQIDRISAPTLVLGATEDRMVPLKFSKTLHERIPDAELVIIQDAGHMFPLEKPDDVAHAVKTWISEQQW